MSAPRGFVLAAGLGSRLAPLTDTLAKPAVPFVGRAILDRVLDGLAAAGVAECAVNVHQAAASVRAVLAARGAAPPQVIVSDETALLLGSGGALRPVLPFLRGGPDFFLVNGDCVHDLDLRALLAEHRRTGASATLAVRPEAAAGFRCLRVDGEGRVTHFAVPAEGRDDERHFLSVQVISASLLDSLPQAAPVFSLFTDWMAPAVARGAVVRVLPTQAEWHAMDSPAQYLDSTANWLARRGGGPHVDPTAQVAAGAVVGSDCALHERCEVGPSARLERTVLLAGARVGAGATLTRCLVGPGVVVAQGTVATSALLASPAPGTP